MVTPCGFTDYPPQRSGTKSVSTARSSVSSLAPNGGQLPGRKKIKKVLDKYPGLCYTIIRKGKEIPKMINKIEDAVIRKYGFEHKITIAVFRFTEILRRLAH